VSDDPDATVNLPALRERARELLAAYRAVTARIAEVEALVDAEALRPAPDDATAPGPNAHPEGEDVVDA
jgi:hypothetical protein